VTDGKDAGDANTPSTEATRHTRTHPAAEARSLRKLGSEPGDTEGINISGHDRQGRSDPASLGAAAHDRYWRQRFKERDYVDPERDYEYYRPAYRYGWESGDRHEESEFDRVEQELREGWDPDKMGLSWEEARPAVRDAFQRRSATEWSDPGNPLA
jgi:hypothetical protein